MGSGQSYVNACGAFKRNRGARRGLRRVAKDIVGVLWGYIGSERDIDALYL